MLGQRQCLSRVLKENGRNWPNERTESRAQAACAGRELQETALKGQGKQRGEEGSWAGSRSCSELAGGCLLF